MSSATIPPPKPSPPTSRPIKLEPEEPRLSISFTCTVKDCLTRSTHQFTKRAYERGIVLVECPGCKNRHLIADHLGWFKESTEDGTLRTVEDLMRARGEKVRRGRLDAGGVVEYSPDE
ncbi:zf-DNL-domain-containing protein [Artomyces pyxidatus]|uniref:Zf-DNL-domain-containing protein n=1 Tax=Artomyces pyxidatus TaxID=48021 RepID=A0ACB8SVL4_9AGAM|nr:zf-DNL-domain-containing protein [Artomyces pyxidatus]